MRMQYIKRIAVLSCCALLISCASQGGNQKEEIISANPLPLGQSMRCTVNNGHSCFK